ncbi:Rmf/CrpP fold protein [Streptomyces longisporoflavus]|uniref:Rmf/CrpP fold protein n=1 Tax=Streptomyces longisporoflavus TaxID=28044 RepID=A0ABW7R3P9_9ACTN
MSPGTREAITRAIAEEAKAGRTGKDPTVCPYRQRSLLRATWLKGYTCPPRAQN